MKNKKLQVWLPLLLAVVMISGMFFGFKLHQQTGAKDFFAGNKTSTLQEAMDLIKTRYVDSVQNQRRPIGGFHVPSYVVGDIRLGWRPDKHWELSITGQNLFDTHQEFAPSYIQTQQTEVEMSVFAKVTYRF